MDGGLGRAQTTDCIHWSPAPHWPAPAPRHARLQANLQAGRYTSPLEVLAHVNLVRLRGAERGCGVADEASWEQMECVCLPLSQPPCLLATRFLVTQPPTPPHPKPSTQQRQVWSNCAEYNAEGSDILAQCQDCRRAFDVMWRLEGLPTDPATWQPARAAQLQAEATQRVAAMPPQQRAALAAALAGAPPPPVPRPAPKAPPAQGAARPSTGGASSGKPAAKRKLSEGAAVSAAGPPAGAYGGPSGIGFPGVAARPAPVPLPPPKRSRQGEGDWTQRANHALNQLMALEASEAFHEPVSAGRWLGVVWGLACSAVACRAALLGYHGCRTNKTLPYSPRCPVMCRATTR